MTAASINRQRKKFRAMGEAATREYLIGARPNLRAFQRRVAAAEHVLKQFERTQARAVETRNPDPEQPTAGNAS